MTDEPEDGDEGSAVQRFLDALEGTRTPYIDVVEDAKNPYCDSCSSPIHRNDRVQLYGVGRTLSGEEPDPGFRAIRLHCDECSIPELFFACEGYDEYLLEVRLDREWRVRDPEIVDVSPESDGIPWDPVEVMEGLFERPYHEIRAMTNYQSAGPHTVVDTLITAGIDPREVIQEDGAVTLPHDAHERLVEAAKEIGEKYEDGSAPPQPDLMESLQIWANADPTEE